MYKLILKCISLSLKKKLFFTQCLMEFILISTCIKNKNLLIDVRKNKLNFSFIQNSRSSFLHLILSYSGNTVKLSIEKGLYNDILRMKVQKFFFFFLTSTPIYLKEETDFDYISTGWIFLFFKISNNLIRSTGTILFLYIIYINLNLIIEKGNKILSLNIQKKAIEILSIDSIKELGILGKLNLIKNKLRLSITTPFLDIRMNFSMTSILFFIDILLEKKVIRKYLKLFDLKKERCVNDNTFNTIFSLQCVELGKLTAEKTIKRRKKKNFILILKNVEILKSFNEFLYSTSLYLILKVLEKRFKNYFIFFIFFHDYFSIFNFIRNQKFYVSNKNKTLRECSNYIVRLFIILELNSKIFNSFWIKFFLNTFLLKNFYKVTVIKNLYLSLIGNWKNYFLFFCSFVTFYDDYMYLVFRNFYKCSTSRVVQLIQKPNFLIQINNKLNYFIGRQRKNTTLKLLKKFPVTIFTEFYFKSSLFIQNKYSWKKLGIILSFSNNDLLKNSIDLLFSKYEKLTRSFNIIFLNYYFIRVKTGIAFTISSNIFSIIKIFKRNKKINLIFIQLRALFFLNLLFRTQFQSLKTYLISKYTTFYKKHFFKNSLNILIKIPTFLILYMNLLLFPLKLKNNFSTGICSIFSIREDEYKNFSIFFAKNVNIEARDFNSRRKYSLFINFLTFIKVFISLKNIFLYHGIQLFSSKSTKFWALMQIFLNKQLNGMRKSNKTDFLRSYKFKLKTTVHFCFTFQRIENSLKFYHDRSFFNYITKNIYDFLIKLPFKTSLNKIMIKIQNH